MLYSKQMKNLVYLRSNLLKTRCWELLELVRKGGGDQAIWRHTQRNKKLFVRERLKLLLHHESFLELSPLAGLSMPYGDVPAAGCITACCSRGATGFCPLRYLRLDLQLLGTVLPREHPGYNLPLLFHLECFRESWNWQNLWVWCVFMANGAAVKGGTSYPIGVKKQLRAQEIAMQSRLVSVYLVDSGGAFLPLQVAVVCGSCVAGGAHIPAMAEEAVIIDKIGALFLAGPPLAKAATGEYASPEGLGGARLHSQVSGCSDHFASSEKEAYECVGNIISMLNYEPLPEEILSRLLDGSRFQEFKANYGMTLVTGFGHVEGHLVRIVANNGELSHDASLKGSHFVQLCSQWRVPILFFQNTAPQAAEPTSISQAEAHASRLKAQASMMAAVACAAVPKITIVVGGCFESESYVMCGRWFSPDFLFLWPNARVGLVDSRHLSTVPQAGDCGHRGEEAELKQLKEKLEESSAFYSSARLWDDGIILPQNTRKVITVFEDHRTAEVPGRVSVSASCHQDVTTATVKLAFESCTMYYESLTYVMF